jgi:tellurite resistance protein
MFLSELTPNERRGFLELAHLVAHADGDLAFAEAQMLLQYRIELDLYEEDYAIQGVPVVEAAAHFESDASKRAALMELMMVVMADGVAHPQEHELLREIEAALGVDDETSDRQFTWVQRLSALISTGKRLIEVGDPYAAAH